MRKFVQFCLELGIKPETVPENIVAQYFVQIADSSRRPKAILSTGSAALSCHYDAIDMPSPVTSNLRKMIEGSVKCGTLDPMNKSKVLPR